MRASEITQKLEQQTTVQQCYHDDSRLMRGALLEVTFEPVFVLLRRPKKGQPAIKRRTFVPGSKPAKPDDKIAEESQEAAKPDDAMQPPRPAKNRKRVSLKAIIDH
jgi:hypothetical protein